MAIIVDLHIICDTPGNKYSYSIVGKEYKSGLVPMVGMKFEDSAWKQPRSIQTVLINPTGGYYHLYVGDHTGKNEDQCEQLKQMYYAHGWTRLVR